MIKSLVTGGAGFIVTNYKALTEKMANTSLSLPVHEFIKESDIKLMTKLIHKFYQK